MAGTRWSATPRASRLVAGPPYRSKWRCSILTASSSRPMSAWDDFCLDNGGDPGDASGSASPTWRRAQRRATTPRRTPSARRSGWPCAGTCRPRCRSSCRATPPAAGALQHAGLLPPRRFRRVHRRHRDALPAAATRPAVTARSGPRRGAPGRLTRCRRCCGPKCVAAETNMAQTLRRLVESAREVLGVSYAAIGVSGPDGVLERVRPRRHRCADVATVSRARAPFSTGSRSARIPCSATSPSAAASSPPSTSPTPWQPGSRRTWNGSPADSPKRPARPSTMLGCIRRRGRATVGPRRQPSSPASWPRRVRGPLEVVLRHAARAQQTPISLPCSCPRTRTRSGCSRSSAARKGVGRHALSRARAARRLR